MYAQAEQIKQIIDSARKIVIIQADNPDSDSLGSALALELMIAELGKEPYLYCAVDMPTYLRYMTGWDRVQKELPHQFDVSIVVDASTMTLFEKLSLSGQQGWVASKPCVVLDHHEIVENQVPFATVMINDHQRASTGELLYLLAKQLSWPLPVEAQAHIMSSILGDTQGLTNQLASAETYHIMADLIEQGVDRAALEEQRRELSKMPLAIFKYKARLISRSEFSANETVAIVTVPQEEINEFSPLYNPAPLIQTDLLQTVHVRVAVVLKHYDDGKITGAIRCNQGAGIAADLAEHFGGGGHAYASGFKLTNGRPINEVKSECMAVAENLLAKLEEGKTDETVQYAHTAD